MGEGGLASSKWLLYKKASLSWSQGKAANKKPAANGCAMYKVLHYVTFQWMGFETCMYSNPDAKFSSTVQFSA